MESITAAPARLRWLRRSGAALAVIVAVVAGTMLVGGDGRPKVNVTAGQQLPAGESGALSAGPLDTAPPPAESTTSTSKSGGVAGTGTSSTTYRVAAPNSSTTATTAAPTTTTATAPPTTTSTAPDRDQRVAVDFAPRLDGAGGWLVRRDGSVTALGSARSLGDAAGRVHDDAVGRFPNEAIGIATTPSGTGYWIATARGEIFPFGDASDRGSLGNVVLAQPIVAFTATDTGDGAQGYLMTDARGSVYNFSSVAVPGLPPGYDRPDPVVAVAAAPDGPGCWLLQRDGKVVAAPASLFVAESPAQTGWTAVDITPTPDGHGYWVLTTDFGVFAFGDAQFKGSAAGVGRGPAVAIVAEPEGDGYWQVTADGAVYGFDAPSFL